MSAPVSPQEGGCRCGALRFRVSAAPMMSTACHCTGCQRMSGGPFSTTLMVRPDAFEVLSGDFVVGGLKGPDIRHQHCAECLSWVFTTFEHPLVNVRAVMMDDTSWIAPFAETWLDEKLPWAESGARHSFDQFPPPDRFEPLMRDYTDFLDRMET